MSGVRSRHHAFKFSSNAWHDSQEVLGWLQDWYTAHCNEEWEHEWGVKIAMLDNPRWTVTIDRWAIVNPP
ncbi:UNVERIFIED_CONTAM: hypothetical protein RKD50_009731 [Streptomyces canus]